MNDIVIGRREFIQCSAAGLAFAASARVASAAGAAVKVDPQRGFLYLTRFAGNRTNAAQTFSYHGRPYAAAVFSAHRLIGVQASRTLLQKMVDNLGQ